MRTLLTLMGAGDGSPAPGAAHADGGHALKKFACPWCCLLRQTGRWDRPPYAKFSEAKKHIYELHYEKVSELELYDDNIHFLCFKANRITLKEWWAEAQLFSNGRWAEAQLFPNSPEEGAGVSDSGSGWRPLQFQFP